MKLAVAPDAVFNCVAYRFAEVVSAVDVLADVSAYVYISSGMAYGNEVIPEREDEVLLCDCTDERAADDPGASHGPRKAEGDRAISKAVSRGINAMSVRSYVVCGPDDYTERLDYWIDHVLNYGRIVIPDDGMSVRCRAYVEGVASAMRVVAEEGEADEAYNVDDRRFATLERMVEAIADAASIDVEVVHAGECELVTTGLSTDDFILCRDYPHVLSAGRLARLGWESTPVEEAIRRSVADYRDGDRDGAKHDPGYDVGEHVLSILDTL